MHRTIGVCIDPAVPLNELARDYRFPEPADQKTRDAYEALKRYFANPAPRSYHLRLADYKWVETMTVPDVHKAMALGILYAGGPDINLPGAVGYRHNAVANNALADDQGARALSAAVAQDPSQWLAAVAITRIALVSPEPARMAQAVSMVKTTLAHDPDNIALQLAWHDLLIAQERAKESLEFARAHPSDCTAAKHALAESLLLSGDTAAGAKLYLEALRDAKPSELHRFRDDMRVAATPMQLKSYEATPDAKKAEWISTFWHYSATSYARTVEARVAEQMIRAAYADVHFRRQQATVSSDHPTWASDSMHMVPWDTRGVTYVRHGAPLHRLRIIKNECTQPYEAWVYTAEDHPWIIWFKRECQAASGAPRLDDWRAIYVPPFCGDAWLDRAAPDLETVKRKVANTPDDLDMRDIFTILSQFDTRYRDLMDYCAKTPLGPPPPGAGLLLTDLYHEGLKLFDQLQWAESAVPQLAQRVRLVIAAYEFQDAQHRPEIAAVSWIPVSDLGNAQSSAASMRFSYVIADTLLRATRMDGTSDVPRSAGGSANGILHNVVTIPNVEVGSAKLRVIAIDPADTTRGGITSKTINVAGFKAPQGMSDIVLAVPNVPGILRRGDFSVEPLPGNIVDLGQSFRLFFEVYGVTRGEEIRTTVSVTRHDDSALGQIRSLFPGKVASRTLTFPRKAELDARGVMIEDVVLAGDLVPGEYTVDVTVKPAKGKSSTKHTTLTVIQ